MPDDHVRQQDCSPLDLLVLSHHRQLSRNFIKIELLFSRICLEQKLQLGQVLKLGMAAYGIDLDFIAEFAIRAALLE